MAVYIIMTLLSLIFAYPVYKPAIRGSRLYYFNGLCLFTVFLLLFSVSALRIHVGNDYVRYTEIMHEVFVHGYVPTEPGFNLLVYALYMLTGYENYLLVFAVFSLLTVSLFIYVIWKFSEDFFLSFLMFLCLGYYFQSLSTVRYYLALPLALIALEEARKHDWLKFLVFALIGASFHRSCLAILVLYPLVCIPWKKWMAVPAALLGISFLFMPDFWIRVVVKLYPMYGYVTEPAEGFSVLNIVRCVLVLLLAAAVAVLLNRADEGGITSYGSRGILTYAASGRMVIYIKLSVLALFLYVCCSFMPQISRIGYYLTLPQILLVPGLLNIMRLYGEPDNISPDKKMNIAKWRTVFLICLLLFCLLYFIRYMRHAGDDGILILPYRSFLFHDLFEQSR